MPARRGSQMRNVAHCLAAVLIFSLYAWPQNRQTNQPIRADDGKTLYDKSASTGSGGPAPRQELTGFWVGLITAKLNPVPPMTAWGQEQFRSHKSHSQYSEAESNEPMKYCDPMGFPRDMLYDNRGFARSEERRVGKEWRCGWSPYHGKKNRWW